MFKLLKNKNYALLFLGRTVSGIGSSLYSLALGWYILTLTSNALIAAGYVSISLFIQLILAPIAGVVVDRFNRVRIVYLTDLIGGCIVLLAGYAIFMHDLSVTNTVIVLYISNSILVINSVFFQSAVGSLEMSVIEKEDIQSAVGASNLLNGIKSLVGLTLGAVIYATYGVVWIFIINGVSFLLSGISEMFVKHKHVKKEGKFTLKSGTSDFKEGLNYLKNKKGIVRIFVLGTFLNLLFTPIFTSVEPFVFNSISDNNIGDYTILLVVTTIGSLVGAVIVGNIKGISLKKSFKFGIFFLFLGVLAEALMIYYYLKGELSYDLFFYSLLGVSFLAGFSNMYLNIPMQSSITKGIDEEYRGRVFALLGVLSQAATPIAILAAGAIIEYSGVNIVLVVITTGILLCTLYAVFSRKIKNILIEIEKQTENESEIDVL